jgi:hypothetical protein
MRRRERWRRLEGEEVRLGVCARASNGARAEICFTLCYFLYSHRLASFHFHIILEVVILP